LTCGGDSLSLPLPEITVSRDRIHFGNLGALLPIIDLETREVRLDPFLGESAAVLVLPRQQVSVPEQSGYPPSSGMSAGRQSGVLVQTYWWVLDRGDVEVTRQSYDIGLKVGHSRISSTSPFRRNWVSPTPSLSTCLAARSCMRPVHLALQTTMITWEPQMLN
jgi:hypothetical protein